jgi:hypothetical protein
MKAIYKEFIYSTLLLALTACTVLAAQPAQTAVPTATLQPASTDTPEPSATYTLAPSATPEPTNTPVPTSTNTPVPDSATPTSFSLPLPSGTPLAVWQGFPIMPDALAGEGDSSSYSFTVMATSSQVQEFYRNELGKLGWDLLASGEGENNTFLLIFMKDMSTFSVSIMPRDDGIIYVLLVK